MEFLKKFEKYVWEVNDEMLAEYPNAFDDIGAGWWDKIVGNEIDTSRTFIDDVYLNIGSSFDGLENGSHAGNLSIYPRNLEGTGVSSYEIINRVKDKIGDVPEAEKLTVSGQVLFGKPISVSLLSRNIEELNQARDFFFEKLNAMPQLKNIVDNNAMGKQEIRLKLKPKAYLLGMSESMIANQVRQGFYGGQAQRLQEGRDELRVWVRFPREDRERIGQMEVMKIKTPAGEFPLSELVEYDIERGPVAIQRYNGMREIRVEADIVDPDESVTDLVAQVEEEIVPELNAKFPGVKLVKQGQQKTSAESGQTIMTFYIVAFFMIIMIMMIHFKSFEQPFLILCMIPLSVFGAIWGHGIHGKPVSILSMYGIVALSGVIINDAVVFLSRYNRLLLKRYKVKDAIIEAGKSRLRPILLTTITTSIGLFPLILERSFQAQFLVPMAISLAYGVAIGTFFILIFFPPLILTLNDFRLLRFQLWGFIKRYWNSEEINWQQLKPEREKVEIAIIHSKRRIEGDDVPEVNKIVSDINL
jgi:multidrug efflux pump subunit AcrB